MAGIAVHAISTKDLGHMYFSNTELHQVLDNPQFDYLMYLL